ncbi:hypothetical protein [Microbacterium sp. EST19A]|uniref:hypothetical protein n=1 Tax=Microbacterium sp. EST19A TaxID=2862681 RepID=UPI001CBE06B1|nr:hypothetical protein [Microbacterium sp. EST19A]
MIAVPQILRHRRRTYTIVRIDRKLPLVYVGLFERTVDARDLSHPCGEVLDDHASFVLQ